MESIERYGWKGIFSISSVQTPWLWDILSINVPPNNWRMATNSNNWIASSHTIIDKNGKMVTQHLLSNAFKSKIYDHTLPNTIIQSNNIEITNTNTIVNVGKKIFCI